jgi:hypothetical protein
VDAAEAAVAHDQHLVAGPQPRATTSGSTSALVGRSARARARPAAPARSAASQPRPARDSSTSMVGAAEAAAASAAFIAPSFIVFERGSTTARMRSRRGEPRRAQARRSWSRSRVGWWAKSSITVTPPAVPRFSSRRRTPPKRRERLDRVGRRDAAWCSAARRSRRSRWRGCGAPASGSRQTADPAAPPHHVELGGVGPTRRRSLGAASRPSASKRSTAFAPAAPASTRREAGWPPFTTRSRPLPGTVRTRWWNCVSIAARSGRCRRDRTPGCSGSQRARPVVDELGALVEERGVVLVGLDDEGPGAPEPPSTRRDGKFSGTPPIRKPGAKPACLEDPREQTTRSWSCRGCRPRRARPAAQHVLGEPLRARDVGRRRSGSPPSAGCRGSRRCRSTPDVGQSERAVVGVEALDQLDAERAQLVAHRRIDAGVAAGERGGRPRARSRRRRP